MMNRSVMQRQMFAKGGAAFRDLNKDGEITQADILMGRGVEFKQEGGIAGMMAAPAMAAGQAGQMDMPTQALQQAASSIDPNVVAGMLNEVDQGIRNLDQAEDFETVMNAMRGDSASIEERRGELAAVVGPEDAAQTPESVLTLVQPVMQIAAIDQGLGGLAQEQMTAPVEGPMAGGIMSTVAPPTDQEAGGTPPVNFKDGGLVRRGDNQPVVKMQTGGDPIAQAGRLGELYKEKMPLYTSILGDPSQGLEEQKRLTQAQMLFDVANTALAFAAPMEGERPGMSPAERLAMAARSTQLPQTIGARAQAQLEREQAAKTQEQQMKLSALSAAEAGLTAEAKAAAELKQQELKGAQKTAEIKLEDKLAQAASKVLESQKQKGRIDLEGKKQEGAMALEDKRQEGAIALEDKRQTNRETLEKVQQDNRVAIKQLEQSGSQSDIILANKLKRENMELQANIDLSKMDVANTYDLAKMEIGNEYATSLQHSRIASQEMIAENQLKLQTINSALDQARADKQLQLNQSKFGLAQQTENRIAKLEQNKFELEEKKVSLDELKLKLDGVNVEGKNKAQQVLARPNLLEGYANGTLSDPETLAVNSAIDQLSTRDTIINADGTTSKTGGQIPQAAKEAIIARNKLPNAKDLLMPRENKRIIAGPQEFGEATSRIMESVPDAAKAFGSDAFARNVANTVIEAITFGFADAPYEATDKAISAVTQLNLDTVTHFQDIKELRDSVTLMNALKQQTANPAEFFTGDTRAKNKTETVLATIDDLLSIVDLKIKNYTDDSDEFKDAMLKKQKALQLRAGFEVIQQAYAVGGTGSGRSSLSSKAAEGADILFGTEDKQ